MTAGQQLQLQRAACRQMLGRGRHFGCHFQTQQRGVGSTRLGRRAQRSHPGVALRTGHGLAQLAGARHRVALALFPGAEQIGDGLAMGLFRQLAQGSLGMVQRITLGTESRVAQTRRTRATLEAVVETTTRTVTAIARAANTAVTPATTIILGLAALRAHAGLRTVIAAHGNGRTMLQGCWCRRTRRPFFGRRSFSRSLRGCCRRFFGMRGHFGSGFALALDGVFQRAHGSVDGLGIALGIGRFQGLGSFHHHLVALAQGGLGMFALLVLALEGFIQRLAEGVPQLLFVLALQRHRLRLVLPALLQRLDGINAQAGGGTQFTGFVNHGLAHLHAGFLRGIEMGAGFGHGGLPARLQFGKHLFAQVAGFAPAAGEAEQVAVGGLPVGNAGLHLPGMLFAPGLEFVHQVKAGGLLFGRMLLHGGQPGFHDAVGLVAGRVETLPQRVVGHAALVGLFPLLTQVAQGFLQLARAELAGRHRTRAGGLCLGWLGLELLGRSRRGFCLGLGRVSLGGGSRRFRIGGCLGRFRRCCRSFCSRSLHRRFLRLGGHLGSGLFRRSASTCGLFSGNVSTCSLGRRRHLLSSGLISQRTCFFSRHLGNLAFALLCCLCSGGFSGRRSRSRLRCCFLGGSTFRAINQRFGLLHQFLANLVGAPTLPTFELSCRSQNRMGLALEFGTHLLAMFLECIAQGLGSRHAGLAMAADQFLLQSRHCSLNGRLGIGTTLCLLGILGCRRLALGLCHCSRSDFLATQNAQFIGPYRHRRQRARCVLDSGTGLAQCIFKGTHHQLQLFDGAFQLRHVLGIHTLPGGILLQGLRLFAPVRHIGIQAGFGRIGFLPALGGQHLDTLRQQHGRLTVHLHAGLQILDRLDALGQLLLERGERLLAQGRTRLGGITLPGHGVGNVQLARLQQLLGLGAPLCRQQLLPLAALDLVQLLAQRLGGTLVARAQFLEHFLHAGDIGVGCQPGTHARSAVARGGRRKHAARQGIKRMRGLTAGSVGGSAGFRAPRGGGIIGFSLGAGTK